MKMKKSLAIGIIFLFIGVAVAPSINAKINDQLIQERLPSATTKTIKVIRYEYKSDGSIDKKVLEVPQNEFRTFQDEFRFAKTMEEKLDLYKKYDLVPQNVSMDTLRKNFNEYVQRINTSKTSIENYAQNINTIQHLKRSSYIQIVVNTDCYVDGGDVFTVRFTLGLSSIIGRINFLIYVVLQKGYFPDYLLPSSDLFMLHISGLGEIYTEGKLGERDCYGSPFFLLMTGFVGYRVIVPFFVTDWFIGDSQLVFAVSGPEVPYQFHQFMN
jgi:hypothetical protein